MRENEKLPLTVEHKLIKVIEMMELESHQFATIVVKIIPSKTIYG